MQSVTAVLMRKSAHKFRWSCIANQAVLCMRTSQLSHKLLPRKRSFALYTGVKTLPRLIHLRAGAFAGSILDCVPLIRKLHMEPVQKVKDRFLSMSLEERRKEYFCKNNFQVFDNIPVWEEYYAEKKTEMPTVRQEYAHEVLEGRTYEINHALNRKVALWPEGDITRLEIDAIVNAANKTLMGGGGVDGCIHKAAGQYLKEECKTLGGCETGEAKITAAYNLPAKYVIHTVGPQGKKPPLLESCYRNSLDLLVKNNLRSIAFPCISTGIYGYPQDAAANVALRTVREYLEKNPDTVDRVVFCTFLRADVEFYEERMKLIFPVE